MSHAPVLETNITLPLTNGIDKPNGFVSECPTPVVAQITDHIVVKPVERPPDKLEDVSDFAQGEFLPSPRETSIDAPNGLLTPIDSEMNEPSREDHLDAPSNVPDVVMSEPDMQTPATTPGAAGIFSNVESNGSLTARTTPNEDVVVDEDDIKPPPAKRPRVHSDADWASLANSASPPPHSHVTSNGTTPTPTTAAPVMQPTPPTPSIPLPGPSTLTKEQHRFCLSTVKSLKKLKDAAPFLRPVDPIALSIPHYPSIIKVPMDLSTVERKVNSSNPAKPDLNPENPRYLSADEFIADVRLIFQNCYTFNGAEHAVSVMGKRVEEGFDRMVKNMPPNAEPKIEVTPPPPALPPAPLKKNPPARRPSTSVPVIRRSDTVESVGRPKREIHPPPPKDLPYADQPKKQRRGRRPSWKDDGTAEQLKFCSKVLHDLHKKQYANIAHPFYEPVDWVKLDIPSYPKMIKRPMDLSTMRKKLDNHEYATAKQFYDDFKLMVRNCFNFNPPATPVNLAGQELQKVFDEKWKQLPPIRQPPSDDDDDNDDDEDTDEDHARTIAAMESQIEKMKGNIAALKNKKKEKKKDKERGMMTAASAKSTSRPSKPSSGKKKNKNKPVEDNDVLSFEQKKDLSEAIAKLDGLRLEKVIHIIHEGVPEIRDSTEEIELEIDLLPAPVLIKLYNFVMRPLRPPPTKRSRTGKGTGTGGLKRKSMDEDVEAEKIRQLEQRMALFENGGTLPAIKAEDSDGSSDSSSGSDSSGSDSE